MVNAPPSPVPTEALLAIAQLVVDGADCDRLLNETAHATARTLGADRCEVLRRSPEDKTLLRVAPNDGHVAEEREIVSGGVSSAAGYTLLCGAPVVSGDLRSDRRFGKTDAPQEALSVVAAPVTGREKPFGVLIAYAVRERAFEDYHAVAVSRTGSLLGGALRHLEELERLRRKTGEVGHLLEKGAFEGPSEQNKPVLTRRQIEVLALMADGRPAKRISSDLNLSIHTVHFHQRNLYRALGVGTSAAAIKRAAELGLLRFPGTVPKDL